jgi:hypothetical protein
MDVCSVMARGRRVRPASIMPRSAAWASRKRKSIDCAFSEFRAILVYLWRFVWVPVVFVEAVVLEVVAALWNCSCQSGGVALWLGKLQGSAGGGVAVKSPVAVNASSSSSSSTTKQRTLARDQQFKAFVADSLDLDKIIMEFYLSDCFLFGFC